MLTEISKEEWINITKDTECASIFIDPVFLEPISRVFRYSIKYFMAEFKAKPALGFACFVKGKSIKVPTHFIYSGLWWDLKYDTIKFRNLLIEAIGDLKRSYNSIEFRLPPPVSDIRPFQWQDFSYQVSYTYTRNTTDLNFEYNIKSRVKKSFERKIVPSVSFSFSDVWNHQIHDLKRFHFSDRLLGKTKSLFKAWFENGFMLIYEARSPEGLVGSSCVLYDQHQSKAYNLLISSANSNYHTGVHAALYNFIFNDLRSRGINNFDLYGADLRGVADFKSSFDAILEAHYTTRYNGRAAFVKNLKSGLKNKLIAIKGKVL
ncbi:GNAT family N-acetyltransferase [Desertivirga xinjiangensis]|uniref:GNAT family N-acetyltransferase n=1 Tax=Desertivirga xinjiangensis TaxID=539206 RepID=UPI00210D410F|nr:GNAT family N-acetyltransferase [Pedobacter xinjiangensis]